MKTKEEIKQIKKKMLAAIESQFESWSHPDKVRCPSLKKMAEYINIVLPQFEARVVPWSESKGRKTGRVYFSRHSYEGNKLEVFDKKMHRIVFEHCSTGTYRVNTDVAEFILRQEKEK